MSEPSKIARAKRYIRGEGWRITGNVNRGYVVEQQNMRLEYDARGLLSLAGMA